MIRAEQEAVLESMGYALARRQPDGRPVYHLIVGEYLLIVRSDYRDKWLARLATEYSPGLTVSKAEFDDPVTAAIWLNVESA